MKTYKLILLLTLLVCIRAFPQQGISISKPDLSYHNDTLVIIFDIKGCSQDDLFSVIPLISSQGEDQIKMSGLSGDLGDNIKCGKDKKIIWSLAADGFMINGDIEVQISAQQVIIEAREYKEDETLKKEITVKDREDITDPGNRAEKAENTKTPGETANLSPAGYSRGNIIASSMIFPGLGQKKAIRKGSPLILGIIGYGGLASAGYFIYNYNKKYNQYLESNERTLSDQLFMDSEKSYNTARYLIFGTAGIWTVNMIWSALVPASGKKDFNAGMTMNNMNGIELYAKWTF